MSENGDVHVGYQAIKEQQELPYEEKIKYLNKIAKPLASKAIMKKIGKLVKKASKHSKTHLVSGVKDVVKSMKKGETGIVFIAGDVTPIDILSFIPVFCEDRNIPYCYVPNKYDLSAAMGLRRVVLVLQIKCHSDYEEAFEELKEQVQCLPTPL